MLGASGRQWRTTTAKWWGWRISEPQKVSAFSQSDCESYTSAPARSDLARVAFAIRNIFIRDIDHVVILHSLHPPEAVHAQINIHCYTKIYYRNIYLRHRSRDNTCCWAATAAALRSPLHCGCSTLHCGCSPLHCGCSPLHCSHSPLHCGRSLSVSECYAVECTDGPPYTFLPHTFGLSCLLVAFGHLWVLLIIKALKEESYLFEDFSMV